MISVLKAPQFYLPPERVEYAQSFPGFAIEDDRAVSPRSHNLMACYAVGIVEDIAVNRPDVAIACDRGGRLFGLAVRSMWLELMDEPFPTLDQKLHFAKISARAIGRFDRSEITEYRVRDRIDSALREGKRRGREPQNDKPRVLVIDDWVSSGDTYEYVLSLSKDLDFDLRYAVMESEGYRNVVEGYREDMAGISGKVELSLPTNLGVDYDEAHRVETAPGPGVQQTRTELYKAVRRVAKFVEKR